MNMKHTAVGDSGNIYEIDICTTIAPKNGSECKCGYKRVSAGSQKHTAWVVDEKCPIHTPSKPVECKHEPLDGCMHNDWVLMSNRKLTKKELEWLKPVENFSECWCKCHIPQSSYWWDHKCYCTKPTEGWEEEFDGTDFGFVMNANPKTKLKAFIHKLLEEKEHDHEILVNTILETKNREIALIRKDE
jgi:hypothetical protein